MIEKKQFRDWNTAYRLTSNTLELIIPEDIGPRILWFGFRGGENELLELGDKNRANDHDTWHMYGGHRLWHAPEVFPRTYAPDNQAIKASIEGEKLLLVQNVEATTGIRKELEIHIDPSSESVRILHRLVNKGVWAIALAPWAITVMAPGGRAIIPHPLRGAHEKNLQPTHSMTLWAYTDMSDKRWYWGKKYIMLDHDLFTSEPQKIGLRNTSGWIAYHRQGHLFVKSFIPSPDAQYPDYGSTVEVFTDRLMLEIETLGTVRTLEPNHAIEHEEQWFLFDGIPTPDTDHDIDEFILPLLREKGIIAS